MTHACHTDRVEPRAWTREDVNRPPGVPMKSPVLMCRAWVQQDWVRPDDECRGCARLPQEAAALLEDKGHD